MDKRRGRIADEIRRDTSLQSSRRTPDRNQRFTRLPNAFSKKIENPVAMLALFHMHYNFVGVHQTLRVTPAMEAGISQHIWSYTDIINLTSTALGKAA